MPKSMPVSERVKAMRRHPGMLKKSLYIAALVALITGTLSQIFSEKNWVSFGSGSDALFVAIAAGIVAAAIGLGKPLLKDSLSDDGEIIRIGVSQEETTPEPWSFTSSRIIALCAAAILFVAVKAFSNDKLISILGASPQSVIRKNAISVCRIASDINSQRISDPDPALKTLSEARDNLNGIASSVDFKKFSFDDNVILFGSLDMIDKSQQVLKGEMDFKSEDSKAYFAQTLVMCETLKNY
jgi:hypothetical protein